MFSIRQFTYIEQHETRDTVISLAPSNLDADFIAPAVCLFLSMLSSVRSMTDHANEHKRIAVATAIDELRPLFYGLVRRDLTSQNH